MIFEAKPVYQVPAKHGESSWWDADRGKVFFMDCFGNEMYSYDPETGAKDVFHLPFHPMAVVPCKSGKFLATSEDTVYLLDENLAIEKTLRKFTHNKPTDRFNDCKCGPDGAFYIGLMGQEDELDEGKLYRLSPEGDLDIVLDGVGISNGIVWTADQKTVYYTDTVHGEVYSFAFADGKLTDKKTIFRDPALQPDGMCIDAEDRIWLALWSSAKVVCIDPENGQILHEVRADVPLTSSAVFGGKDLTTLYITTSRLLLTEQQTEEFPHSGSLYAAEVGVKGALMFKGDF